MSAKLVRKIVNFCRECPYFVCDLGGEISEKCEILNRKLEVSDSEKEIDPDCPLPDAQNSSELKSE